MSYSYMERRGKLMTDCKLTTYLSTITWNTAVLFRHVAFSQLSPKSQVHICLDKRLLRVLVGIYSVSITSAVPLELLYCILYLFLKWWAEYMERFFNGKISLLVENMHLTVNKCEKENCKKVWEGNDIGGCCDAAVTKSARDQEGLEVRSAHSLKWGGASTWDYGSYIPNKSPLKRGTAVALLTQNWVISNICDRWVCRVISWNNKANCVLMEEWIKG